MTLCQRNADVVSAYLADHATQHLLLTAHAAANVDFCWCAPEARQWAQSGGGPPLALARRVRDEISHLEKSVHARSMLDTLPDLSVSQLASVLLEGLENYIEQHCQGETVSVLLPPTHPAGQHAFAYLFGSLGGGCPRLEVPQGVLETTFRASGYGCAPYEVTRGGVTVSVQNSSAAAVAAIAEDDLAEQERLAAIADQVSPRRAQISMVPIRRPPGTARHR